MFCKNYFNFYYHTNWLKCCIQFIQRECHNDVRATRVPYVTVMSELHVCMSQWCQSCTCALWDSEYWVHSSTSKWLLTKLHCANGMAQTNYTWFNRLQSRLGLTLWSSNSESGQWPKVDNHLHQSLFALCSVPGWGSRQQC